MLNTSLLVKAFGRVTYVDTHTPATFFYIDDGSALSDGLVISGNKMRGIRVSLASLAAGNAITPPSVNQHLSITNICSPQYVSGKVLAQIRPRSQADIGVVAE